MESDRKEEQIECPPTEQNNMGNIQNYPDQVEDLVGSPQNSNHNAHQDISNDNLPQNNASNDFFEQNTENLEEEVHMGEEEQDDDDDDDDANDDNNINDGGDDNDDNNINDDENNNDDDIDNDDNDNDNDDDDDNDDNEKKTEKEKQKIQSELDQLLGCEHYKRNCLIKAVCCNKYYHCRFCHNENNLNHEMDRYAVKEVKCLKCSTEQPISRQCIQCGITFGRYYCEICKFFDNHPTKQIYHCAKCGLCRVGDPTKFFHCDTCCMDLSINLQNNHKCVEKNSHQNCPICFDFLFTSTKKFMMMKCNHAIHISCYSQMLKKGIYTCPLCQKSVVDTSHHNRIIDQRIAETPMPSEYQNVIVKILCKDCQHKGEVKWHVFGMKCGSCGSYNTTRM